VQLWTDESTPWESIGSPLNISKWVVSANSGEFLPVVLDEYLVPASPDRFADNPRFDFIPYGRNAATGEDQPALFPTRTGVTAIRVQLFVEPGQNAIACPVSGYSFGSTAGSMLRIGDSLTVSFSSTNVPARVKICGRYQPQPGVNNGNSGQYTFTHTVQSGDDAGTCNVMVYLTFRLGLLPVYEQATDLTVDPTPKPFEGKCPVFV